MFQNVALLHLVNPFLENNTKAMYYLKMKYEKQKVRVLLIGNFLDKDFIVAIFIKAMLTSNY